MAGLLGRSPSLVVCRPLEQEVAQPAAGFRSFRLVNILSNYRLYRCSARAMTFLMSIALA